MSCGATRARMLDVVRGTASDAVRLELESHVESCAGCREERAAWSLVETLRAEPAPRLGAGAERRVLERLVSSGGAGRAARAVRGTRSRWLLAGVSGVSLVALAVGAWVVSAPLRRRGAEIVVEGQTIEATRPGVIAFAGAGVSYGAGTAMKFHPASRTLEVARGEVDVDVKEGLPGRFRVRTPRFIVEVLGTRFVVTPAGVRTLRGHVRVLDLAGHELSMVHAGETWSDAAQGATAAPVVPAPPVLAPAVVVTPPAPVVVRRAAPSAVVTPPATLVEAPARASVGGKRVSVSELLARGRAALAAGDAAQARGLIERAQGAGPSDAEAPALELLQADALLVARRPDDAIAAYRRVARHRPRAPEGETAAFAVGQLLFERGAQSEAGAALYDYLARYPHGRFVREARERLTQIQGPQ